MKLLKLVGMLAALTALAGLALVEAPSAFGQSPDRFFEEQARRLREFTLLNGRGAEIGVRVTDAADGGVKIEEVQPDGPADKAGLKAEDVIVEFDGEHVRGSRQFARLVQETPPGRTVKATVIRAGQKKEVQLTPGSGRGTSGEYLRPFNLSPDFNWPAAAAGPRLGVTVEEMTSQLAEHFGAKEGVLVTSVTDGSAAARAGVHAGDVITSINGQPIGSRGDLMRGLRDAVRSDGTSGSTSDSDVKLGIIRDRNEMTVTVRIEGPIRAQRGSRPALFRARPA